MPEIEEVFAAFPEGRFLVNYKSNEAREGDMLSALVESHLEYRPQIWGVYGGGPPTERTATLIGRDEHGGLPLAAFTSRSVRNCLVQYLAIGWTGFVPDTCRNTTVMVPINFAWLAWGWPNLFLQRMQEAGTNVILVGPYAAGDPGTDGIDSPEELAQVPEAFTGYLWTNRIEVIGPLVKHRDN